MDAYTKVLNEEDGAARWRAGGKNLLLLESTGGTWEFIIETPEGGFITVGNFTSSTDHRYEVPNGTWLRLVGGSIGSKAWNGKYGQTVGDFL